MIGKNVKVKVMRVKASCAVLILMFCAQGCRSPRAKLESLHRNEPCFQPVIETPSSTLLESSPTVSSIEDYVQLGLLQNPAVAEAQFKMDAARQRFPQVLSLPDPMVSTNTYLAPVQTAAGEQAFSLGFNQKFTNSERRATQASIVCEEVAAAEANLERVRLELAEDIRSACYQLMFVRKSIEIVEADQKSLEQIEEVVLRQYEVKKDVTQQDVLSIQVEQSAIENQLTELRQREKSHQARLARLSHVAPNSDLQITDAFCESQETFNVESMIEAATQNRPELHSQLAMINRDRKKVHLAGLENKPDFTVGLNWITTSTQGISPVRNGDDALLLGVGFNLPIYKNRIQAGVCEALANRRASESRLAVLQDEVAEEVYDLIAKIEGASVSLKLLQQDMIPKAERSLELSIEEYSAGNVQYVQLIENWRGLLKFRIAEANLQSQYSQLLTSLSRSVGQMYPLGNVSDDSDSETPF
ncbi:MAG: TolC family protein [Pirellulaceae bacterium]